MQNLAGRIKSVSLEKIWKNAASNTGVCTAESASWDGVCQSGVREYASAMKITSQLFEAFLKCVTKCHLRSLGETGSGNEYADWVRAQDESYQREASCRLQEGVPETERCTARDRKPQNRQMASGGGHRSSGVLACEFRQRLAARSNTRRDARRTRRRDVRATNLSFRD
jgi:hypothetical protein